MRRNSTGRCLVRPLQPPHWWSLTIESVSPAATSQRDDGDAASRMLRRAWACTVGNSGSTNPGFTLRTGLAERHLHPFNDFRFPTMLLSSLGFPAKSGRVLKVFCSQPHPLAGRISSAPKRRTSQAQICESQRVQEGVPPLSSWRGLAHGSHILLNRVFADAKTQLKQFASDPLRSPPWVIRGHFLDECH